MTSKGNQKIELKEQCRKKWLQIYRSADRKHKSQMIESLLIGYSGKLSLETLQRWNDMLDSRLVQRG